MSTLSSLFSEMALPALAMDAARSSTIEELLRSIPSPAVRHYLATFNELEEVVVSFCLVRKEQLQLQQHLDAGTLPLDMMPLVQPLQYLVPRAYVSRLLGHGGREFLHGLQTQALATRVALKDVEAEMLKFRFTAHALRARNKACLALAKGQLSPLWLTTLVYMFSYIFAL